MLALLGLTLGGCGVDWFPAQVTEPGTSGTPGTPGTTGTGAGAGTTATAVTAFSFSRPSLSGVAAGSTQTSDTITVALSGTSAAISVSGGQYKINDGTFTSAAGSVSNSDRVTVQHTAASGDGETVTAALTIGDKSATFSSTTASAFVAAFSFSPASVTGVSAGSRQISNTITVALTGTALPISVTGGEYQIGDGSYTSAAGAVKNHDTVTLRHTAPSGAGQTVTTLTIGGKSATFSSTTASTINSVTTFSFAPASVTGVAAGSTQTSDTITVAVTGTSAAVSVSGGQYKVNNGSFTSAAGSVSNNDNITVQHTAASADGQTVSTTLTIGDKSANFSSTTASSSVSAFSFSPVSISGVAGGLSLTSNAITVALSSGTVASISVAGGDCKINDGSYTSAAGTVRNNDKVTVRHTSASVAGQTVTTTLIIGEKSATFSSTATTTVTAINGS